MLVYEFMVPAANVIKLTPGETIFDALEKVGSAGHQYRQSSCCCLSQAITVCVIVFSFILLSLYVTRFWKTTFLPFSSAMRINRLVSLQKQILPRHTNKDCHWKLQQPQSWVKTSRQSVARFKEIRLPVFLQNTRFIMLLLSITKAFLSDSLVLGTVPRKDL